MHGSSISLLEVCILESSCDVVIFCTLMSKGKNYKAKKKKNQIRYWWDERLELGVIYFFCVMKSTKKKCNLFSYFFHWYNLLSTSCRSPYYTIIYCTIFPSLEHFGVKQNFFPTPLLLQLLEGRNFTVDWNQAKLLDVILILIWL